MSAQCRHYAAIRFNLPSGLKICAPVAPAPGNTHSVTQFFYKPFSLRVKSLYSTGQTNKTHNAAY